jgi:hypothetical protein
MNPLAHQGTEQGFARRAHNERLGELFAASMGHNGEFRAETLDMLRFAMQIALRNE